MVTHMIRVMPMCVHMKRSVAIFPDTGMQSGRWLIANTFLIWPIFLQVLPGGNGCHVRLVTEAQLEQGVAGRYNNDNNNHFGLCGSWMLGLTLFILHIFSKAGVPKRSRGHAEISFMQWCLRAWRSPAGRALSWRDFARFSECFTDYDGL